MSTLFFHSPALIVAVPLLGAFLLMVVSSWGAKHRDRVFFGAVALAALFALSLAARVLGEGPVSYVFGAASRLDGILPPDSGGIPVRIIFLVDGAGAMMLVVAALSSLAASIYALRSEEMATGQNYFFPLFLLLVAGVYGMAATGDIFNFFVFLEIASLSGAALTAYRIDKGLAAEAGLKYAAISTLGGLSFLLGVGILLAQHNVLNMAALAKAIDASGFTRANAVAMALMAVPMAMKCGAVPMHHWVPDTYSRAPSPVSAFLLVSHHAVSQTGYMLLGAGVCLAVLGDPAKVASFGRVALAGSLFHMVNYALYNGLLFLGAGAVIYRTGKRDLNDMGGLGHAMPWTMVCFGVGALAIAGIPPMSGFSSKLVLYESVFKFSPFLSIVAMVVSLLTLASFVKVFQAMFLGPRRAAFAEVREVPWTLLVPMALLALATIWIGVYPEVAMDRLLLPAADALIQRAAYLAPGGAM